MVDVIFYGLIRSNHKLQSLKVNPGTMEGIIHEIRLLYPNIQTSEFESAVWFINDQKITHLNRKNVKVNSGDRVVFTNFVGGG